jgi:hypothetical protein
MLEIVYKLLKADTVLIMDYCVYCTEEIGDLTQITLPTGVSQVYICKACLKYMSKKV